MAFEIRDLLIDVLPSGAGRLPLWMTCEQTTDMNSDCQEPSCGGQCKPRSHCGPLTRPAQPQPPTPGPEEIAASAALHQLRQQLRQTLAQP